MEILVGTIALAVGLFAGWALAATRAEARVRRAEVRAVESRALLEAERRVAAERVSAAQADRTRLNEQFRALAADALRANSEQFMVVAEERLKRSQEAGAAELSQREDAVKQLVEPLTRTLDQVKSEVVTAERARLQAQSALAEQLRGMRESSDLLRSETTHLVTALRSSQVRGRWGEIQLRRVVEAAGMVEHVDFVEQSQVRTDDGRLRPDMLVRLAGGKNVVIDAKVAFLGYLDAVQAQDDTVRAERMAAHARHMRKHIDDLAAKEYWEQFSPAPEFVVMFVPAEAFLHTALEVDPTLIEHAMEHNVVLHGVLDQGRVDLERGVQEGFGRHEHDHELGRGGELLPVLLGREVVDVLAHVPRMGRHPLGPNGVVLRLHRVQVAEERHLGVDDDVLAAGELHEHVGPEAAVIGADLAPVSYTHLTLPT